MRGIFAPAFFLLGLSACAHSSQSERLPNAPEVISLQYDFQRMLGQLSCFRGNYETLRRAAMLKFGERMEAIREWSERALGRDALDQAMQSQWPKGFIFVGGCRINGLTGEAHDPRPRFEQQLEAFEKRIPDQRD